MSEPTLSYAHAPPQHAKHSRLGQIAFACAAAAACGIPLTIILSARPIPGPMGSFVRERVAPVFGAVVLLLWLAGVALGIVALLQRGRLRTFAAWALGLCGAMLLLFLLFLTRTLLR